MKNPATVSHHRSESTEGSDSLDSSESFAPAKDHPNVLIFPPVLPLGGLLSACTLEWIFPWSGEPAWLPTSVREITGVLIALASIALLVSSRRALTRARTNVNPRQPTLKLVEIFPYNRSRNPMYLGGNIGLVGLALVFHLHWMVLLLPVLFTLCHYGVVQREEAYLEHKFGGRYLDYRKRVRRWF